MANQEPFSLVRNFDPAAAIRVFTIVDVATITSAQSDSGIDARVTDVSSNPLVSLTGTIQFKNVTPPMARSVVAATLIGTH